VGSGRTIKSFHLLNALTSVGDLFQRFGGHAQAAGFTIAVESIAHLSQQFEEYARKVLTASDLEPVLHVDAPIDLAEVDWPLYEEIIQLAPFGTGNRKPVFGSSGVRLVAAPRIVKEKHLKLRVGNGVCSLDALGWGRVEQAPSLTVGQQVDLAFNVERNSYQGMASLQLNIKDIVATGGMAPGLGISEEMHPPVEEFQPDK
jgi:single-stranded-DNA-specific exonuclease